jgi:hypothetical protein
VIGFIGTDEVIRNSGIYGLDCPFHLKSSTVITNTSVNTTAQSKVSDGNLLGVILNEIFF